MQNRQHTRFLGTIGILLAIIISFMSPSSIQAFTNAGELTAVLPENSSIDAQPIEYKVAPQAENREVGPDFMFIVFPDTQMMAEDAPEAFYSMGQWVANNKEANNIVFATHVGDIVNWPTPDQYDVADEAMGYMDGVVGYSVSPGNHDFDYPTFDAYFGQDRFIGNGYYQGGYTSTNNLNSYSFFSASGLDFIIINLQYDPETYHLNWADSLLKAYPDRRGIVVSHSILTITDGWADQGIYTALKDNPNLFMMLCGHDFSNNDGAAYKLQIGDYGNEVHIILANYQGYPDVGNAYLRTLRFSPADNKIYMRTYSPYRGSYVDHYPDQMTIDYDMSSSTTVNLPPVNLVPGPQVIEQDTTLVFSGANKISVSDPDAGEADVQITLSVMNGNINLTQVSGLTFSAGDGVVDSSMSFTGSLTDLNAALDGMTYTPATGYFGSDVLTILSNDLGNTGYGGAQTDTDTVGITVEAKFEVTYLDLWQSTDQIVWDQIPGSYNQGFELELDPAFEYYYLDTETITTNRALADGYYAFYINSYPDGFFDYWANKNVYEGCTGTWEPAMWGIINGDIPIFYLKVTGSDYILVDGLTYYLVQTDDLLRINGDYHLGSYTFSGELTDVLGYTDEVTVPITFYWYPYREFIPMILQ